MSPAPVEYVVVEFPGNRFNGQIVPELVDLVDRGIIRIIDLIFITKDADGNVEWVEVNDTDDEIGQAFAGVGADVADLLNEEDIELVAAELAPETSAGLLVWEHLWAAPFVDAVAGSAGQVKLSGRIPADIVQAALDHAAAGL